MGCIFISFAVLNLNTTKDSTVQGVNTADQQSDTMDNYKYTKYNTVLSGAQVIEAIKELANDKTVIPASCKSNGDIVLYSNVMTQNDFIHTVLDSEPNSALYHMATTDQIPIPTSFMNIPIQNIDTSKIIKNVHGTAADYSTLSKNEQKVVNNKILEAAAESVQTFANDSSVSWRSFYTDAAILKALQFVDLNTDIHIVPVLTIDDKTLSAMDNRHRDSANGDTGYWIIEKSSSYQGSVIKSKSTGRYTMVLFSKMAG